MEKQPISPEHRALLEVAKDAADKAYAPYSQFPVGAALTCSDGTVISGCNVENASYGLTVCAERNAIATAVAQGHRTFDSIVVYTPQKSLIPPCGACRQVIAEFMPANGAVVLVNDYGESQSWTVEQMLPAAFGPSDLSNSKEK